MTANKYAFEHKVVLVTGAGSGMGRAIARAFLDNNATVIVTGRREQALKDTVATYPNEKILIFPGDIAKPETSTNLINTILNKFGKLDIVVSNAGQFIPGDLENFTPDEWKQLRSVNLDSFFYLAKAAFPALKQTQGSIIATSSVSGLGGDWHQSAYNATKHALNGFIRSLALDWGKYNVRVNAIAPAFTITEMAAGIAQEGDPNFDKEVAPFVNRIALGRVAFPDDIAPAVLFLASQDAKYITGVILPVDGGTSASTGQPHIE